MAFSTANPNAARGKENGIASVRSIDNEHIDPLLGTSALATEEAIINSMVAGEDMTGHKDFSVVALPHNELQEVMMQYGRREEA